MVATTTTTSATSYVPRGYVPVCVTGSHDTKRYLIKAKHLNHPLFLDLLQLTAHEYGYSHKGIIKIICDITLFEKVLACLSRRPLII
ncbi:hypothetical protein L7F22_063662 [Adiantum nelumboides]|nr:hypothetical protein [Adiantum nelumboides]